MTAPREVLQTVPLALFLDDQTPAAAWLLGYVRTDAPGYREIVYEGNLYVVAADEYRFDDYVTAVDTALTAVSVNAQWQSYGSVTFDDTVTFGDRAGWVLGSVTSGESVVMPPAGIALLGATWTRVIDEHESRRIIDRHRRNQGFSWGDGSIWTCTLKMRNYSLDALMTGWCLRGKVTLSSAAKLATPVSPTELTGAITGYVLGIDSVRWLDEIQTLAEVILQISTV